MQCLQTCSHGRCFCWEIKFSNLRRTKASGFPGDYVLMLYKHCLVTSVSDSISEARRVMVLHRGVLVCATICSCCCLQAWYGEKHFAPINALHPGV